MNRLFKHEIAKSLLLRRARNVAIITLYTHKNRKNQTGLSVYKEALDKVAHQLIKEAMIMYKGNQTRVAIELGINRGSLRTKLDNFDIPYNYGKKQ